MDAAFRAARSAFDRGEVPVGAAVLDSRSGRILSEAGNRVEVDADPSAHAEILAIRDACSVLGVPRLPDADLFVTLEPCAMCAAAISFARIRRVVFAAYDPKGGALEHGPRFFEQATCHHRPEWIGGVREGAASALLQTFFQERRDG